MSERKMLWCEDVVKDGHGFGIHECEHGSWSISEATAPSWQEAYADGFANGRDMARRQLDERIAQNARLLRRIENDEVMSLLGVVKDLTKHYERVHNFASRHLDGTCNRYIKMLHKQVDALIDIAPDRDAAVEIAKRVRADHGLGFSGDRTERKK